MTKGSFFIICIFFVEGWLADAFSPGCRPQGIRSVLMTLSAALVDKDVTSEGARNAEIMKDTDIEAMMMEDDEIRERDISILPAVRENKKFECDSSVTFWNNYEPPSSLEESIRRFNEINARFVSKGPDAIDYMTRHMARYGYFGANTILGGVATILHDQLVNRNNEEKSGANALDKFAISSGMFAPLSMVNRAVELASVFEQDYENICKGKYVKPYDMYEQTQQSNPLFIGQQTGRFVREAIGTLTRRSRGRPEDKELWLSNKYAPDLYPKYYRTQFHYQTDGWMSKESADVYDTSTETLFMGGQDSMQREAIFPVRTAYNKLNASGEVTSDRPFRVLEVACGTGRFATFLRDNLPTNTLYTAVDLSPFYLDATRDNDSNWRSMKRKQLARDGGDRNVDITPTRVVQAQAERLPFADGEFDAVVCIHLFHELPRPIRAKAAAEMARVVRAGGTVVFDDSIQMGDQPWLDERLPRFENFNEPYYQDYLRDDLPSHFERAGLECGTKSQCFRSKCLTFSKP